MRSSKRSSSGTLGIMGVAPDGTREKVVGNRGFFLSDFLENAILIFGVEVFTMSSPALNTASGPA
jgi:hypothetical protein